MANAYESERVSETVFVRMKPSTRARLEREAAKADKGLSETTRELIEEALDAREAEAAA